MDGKEIHEMKHIHNADHGINVDEVIAFFDRLAPEWDATTVRNEDAITTILDNAGITAGSSVLDVACGTGVLFGDYLDRDVSRLVAVDISPEMAGIAAAKSDDPRVKVLCGDVLETDTGEPFDCVMIYNAFPHFAQPAELIREMAARLRPGGRLSVAHGLSRAQLAVHHSGSALRVSMELPTTEELAELFRPYFDVDVQIDNDEMYQVCGVRKG